jgi:hypothetical protein
VTVGNVAGEDLTSPIEGSAVAPLFVILDGCCRPVTHVFSERVDGDFDCHEVARRDHIDEDLLRHAMPRCSKGRSHSTVAPSCSSICTSMEAKAGLPRYVTRRVVCAMTSMLATVVRLSS